MTKGEEAFLDQYTRKLMVDLCLSQMVYGEPFKGLPLGQLLDPVPSENPFIQYAVSRKWLAKDLSRVLSAGWMTAARFLKR